MKNRLKKMRFIALTLTMFAAFGTFVKAGDIDVKLTTTDGSTGFTIQDSANVAVATVTSNGDATFNSLTQAGSGGNLIRSTSNLQTGATFYVSSGTVSGSLVSDNFARVGGVIDRNFTDVVSNNENAEHSMYSFSVPGNLLGTNRAIHVYLRGTYLNTSAATKTIRLRLKYGATTVLDKTSATNASSATTGDVRAEFIITNSGATNTQEAVGQMLIERATLISPIIANGTAAEDSTVAKTLDITITHSAAHASTTFTKLAAYAVLE